MIFDFAILKQHYLDHKERYRLIDLKCLLLWTPEKVKIQVSNPFHKLLQLEPLHPSQQITKETKQSIQAEITVDINPELCGRLLSMGPACKVLSPKKLADQMKTLVQEMAEKYK